MTQLPSREDLLKAQEYVDRNNFTVFKWGKVGSDEYNKSDPVKETLQFLLTTALDRDVVMVPREPTKEMWKAFDDNKILGVYDGLLDFDVPYKAMLVVSPYAQELTDAN